MDYPIDPLVGLDFNYDYNGKDEVSASLYSEPSWLEASKDFSHQRPTIPSSDASIPHSFKQNKISQASITSDSKSINSSSTSFRKSTKRDSNHSQKFSDPKAAELLQLCRKGWTLSKGQKTKPVLGRINPVTIENDIQDFADRYSDARSKSSKGNELGGVGERFEPHMWPNHKTVMFTRPNRDLKLNPQKFRNAELGKSTLGNPSYSFPKDIRLHPEKFRAPGPVFDTTAAYAAILKRHSTTMIGAAGRTIAGSIYYDQFNLKSHGNYYNANEAYLNHTSAPAARCSPAAVLPPKDNTNNPFAAKQSKKIADSKNPMAELRKLRLANEEKEKKKHK